ncbi:preprotein translocase subunit SecG [Qipengyuania nanhaisediminis]|uniref:preprotein translocase subunit SecG n=1 Tax=Qipengyuania nanhaisediminis TaxID=604088 RepID=UPI0038B25CFC
MSLFIILTVIQAIVAAALVGVVLMQRSEGGGLGIGGNPSGALGARGAADFLTRSTRWLAIAFVVLSIVLAALAVNESRVAEISTTLDRDVAAPAADDLLADPAAPSGAATADDLLADPADNASDDPLAE